VESEHVEHLERELAGAVETDDRIDLLNRLSSELHRIDATRALKLARRAVALAVRNGDRRAAAESYRNLGLSHYFLSSFGVARRYLHRALRLFTAINDSRGRAHTLSNLGTVGIYSGDYSSSLHHLLESLDLGRRIGDVAVQAIAVGNLGVLYGEIGDYARALDCYRKGLALKEELGLPRADMASDITNIGTVHFVMSEWGHALECFSECLELHRARGDLYGQILARFNIGTAHSAAGDLEAGISQWLESLALAREIDSRHHIVSLLQNLGQAYSMQGNHELAIERLEEGIAIARESRMQHSIADLLLTLATVRRRHGNLHEAIDLVTETLHIAQEIGARESEMAAFGELADVYEAIGDIDRAFASLRRFISVRDEILSAEKQNAITEVRIRMEIEGAERAREILRLENLRLEEEARHKSAELIAVAMQVVRKNELLENLQGRLRELEDGGGGKGEIRKLVDEIEADRGGASDWDLFEDRFRSIHPEFMEGLARKHPTLSPTEMKVCALLKIGLSTKEIANILCCSPRTVEDHRYRIRTKLGITTSANLASMLAGM